MTKKYFADCETLDEAKSLYKKLAMKLHPDVSSSDTEGEFKEMLNQFSKFVPKKEKFEGEKSQFSAEEYAEIINELMKIPGIVIEICGSWIWLSGNTKPVKEQIKGINTGENMKRGFSKHKEKWFFRPASYRKKGKPLAFEDIQKKYGYRREYSNSPRQVEAK